jgi:RHS repeat-associated protein
MRNEICLTPITTLPVNGMFFFHNDQVGSVRTITGSNGEMITGSNGASRIVYGVYGDIDLNNSQGPDVLRKKYTGQTLDNESGLYYYNARYYDPALGRFITADSIADTGGPNGLNRYMYTRGNPILYNDPSGHDAPKWMENMKKDITKAMINHAVSQNPTAALLYMAVNKKSSDDYKKKTMIEKNPGGWFDRQVVNPIQHMTTAELVIGTIVFVAAVVITVVTGGAGGFLMATLQGLAVGILLDFAGSILGRQMGGYSGSSTNKLRWNSKKADRGQNIGGNAAAAGGLFASITEPFGAWDFSDIGNSLARGQGKTYMTLDDVFDNLSHDFKNMFEESIKGKILPTIDGYFVGEALAASIDNGGSSINSNNRDQFIKDPFHQGNQNADARTIYMTNEAAYVLNGFNLMQIYSNVLSEYTQNIICNHLKDICVPKY